MANACKTSWCRPPFGSTATIGSPAVVTWRPVLSVTSKRPPRSRRMRMSGFGPRAAAIPVNPPRVRVANEFDSEARPMSEIGGVNDIDHGDDVPASPPPVQGRRTPSVPRPPARRRGCRRSAGGGELHSTADPHGMTASDTADASLIPTAFAANARQMYCAPFVEAADPCRGVDRSHLDCASPCGAAVA